MVENVLKKDKHSSVGGSRVQYRGKQMMQTEQNTTQLVVIISSNAKLNQSWKIVQQKLSKVGSSYLSIQITDTTFQFLYSSCLNSYFFENLENWGKKVFD